MKELGQLANPFDDDGPFDLPPDFEKPIDRDNLVCTVGTPEAIPPVPPNPRDVCEISFARRVENCRKSPGRNYATCMAVAYIKYLGCRALRGFDPPQE